MEFSFTEENYLKAIYHLSQEGDQAVLTNALADVMQTRAASATDMIKRLSAKELVHYERYHGVKLTARGKQCALQVIRKHRLWETFLVDKLGFSWDEVHEVAEQLEHIQSPRLINKLDEYLNFPTRDPHGDPIPDATGRIKILSQTSLDQLASGKKGVITSVKDNDPKLLQYLEKIGAKPGRRLHVIRREEYDQSVEIMIDKKKYFLSREVSQHILLSV